MISQSLDIVSSELNVFLKRRFGWQEDMVVLSSLISPDGGLSIKEQNRVVCTLTGMEEQNVNRKFRYSKNPENGQFAVQNPLVNLNLFVLFSAYFGEQNYRDALKAISAVVEFFQGKLVFNHQNTPALPDTIDKVVFEMANLSFHELNYMWGMLGAKYLPSALYRMRMLIFDSDAEQLSVPAITGTGDEAEAH